MTTSKQDDANSQPGEVRSSEGLGAWQPIATAPRDGTRVLLANATHFCAGQLVFRIEPETKYLGYDEGIRSPQGWFVIGPRFMEIVPNPDAGKRHEWWHLDNPVAFLDANELTPDYDGNFPEFEPTHWLPMIQAPNAELSGPGRR